MERHSLLRVGIWVDAGVNESGRDQLDAKRAPHIGILGRHRVERIGILRGRAKLVSRADKP